MAAATAEQSSASADIEDLPPRLSLPPLLSFHCLPETASAQNDINRMDLKVSFNLTSMQGALWCKLAHAFVSLF